jgi:hypothetical protein
MRYCKWIVYSLRSTRCEECSSSRIPPDPNETSAMARHTPTQYSSDNTLLVYRFLYPIYQFLIRFN